MFHRYSYIKMCKTQKVPSVLMLLEFFLDLILHLDAEFRLSACTCQSAQHQTKAGGIFNCNEGEEFQQNSDPHCAERITHFYSCQRQKCYNLMFRSKEFCHRPNCVSFISSDLLLGPILSFDSVPKIL